MIESDNDNLDSLRSSLREIFEAVIVAVIIALFIKTFLVQAFMIPSGSMENTLQVGDHILVNKLVYGFKIPFFKKNIVPFGEPKRGDVIVFEFPKDKKKDYVKRVIGLPGDRFEIKNNKVYINNILHINEPYAVFKNSDKTDLKFLSGEKKNHKNYGPLLIPEDSFFVMGDNRDRSYDSRYWGFVSRKAIKGKPLMIFWSYNSRKSEVRWDRLGSFIN